MNTTQTYTVADLQRMAQDCQQVVNTYLLAKANAQLCRERVRAVQGEWLRRVGAVYKEGANAGQPITDPAFDWMMSDEQFARYCAGLSAEWRERGWLTPEQAEKGFCPALLAQRLQIKLERAVLQRASQSIGVFAPDGLLNLDLWRKALDLVVRATVNHPGYQRPQVA